jgi:hypothetical protein
MKRSRPGGADTNGSQDPPFKVPKRTGPTPVVRIQKGFRGTGPPSPVVQLTPRERLLRGIRAARLQLYKHSPITENHIRLLMVNPGEAPDEIFVSLKTVSINELRRSYEYEALSYHWGDGDANYPIYVRDVFEAGKVKTMDEVVLLGMKRLYVKHNLYKALKALRRNDVEVILWVDAICINQENEVEKEFQVAKMARIYSMAERVCIWLGSGDKRSDNAMSFISDILQLEKFQNVTRDEAYTSRWNDLVDLMRSSWFSRRWVIQELALAKDATVHCSKAEVHWNDFKDAISLFVMQFDTIRELFKRSKEFSHNYYAIGELEPLGAKVLVDNTSNIFRKDAEGTNFKPIIGLETLVSTLSTFEASDPRDTVHALRNIAKEIVWSPSSKEEQARSIPPPSPDYKKDLLEVYTDFVRWVIKTSGSIDIICRHWAMPEKTERTYSYPPLVKLPSWIQEISESPFGRQEEGFNGRKNGDSLVGMPGRKWYNASHGKLADGAWFGQDLQQEPSPVTSPPSQTNSTSNNASSGNSTKKHEPSLYVKGLLINTVTWASDPIPDGVIPKVCLQKGGWTLLRAEQVDKAPDKLWRTLVADRGADGRNPPSWYHRACLYCLVNDTPNGHINTRELLGKGQPDIVRDYLKRVQAVTWNRVFLEADAQNEDEEKLFGLGPPKTEPGDFICILFGCSVPCILRKHPHEVGTYEFIGEAFIYGKMDGEAVTSLTEEDLNQQTREFRLM